MSRSGLAVIAAFAALTWLAGPASGYEAMAVANGGTITGKVTYTGPPVPPRKELRTKDPQVCGEGEVDVPQMILGASKAVADTVVYLKGIAKGKALEKPAKPPEIVNHKCDFVPHVQAIPVGQVVIVNSDPVIHNTHGYYGRITAFNVGLPTQGLRIIKPLPRPGLVKVDCDVHGWMLGWIQVVDNPYYAVTGKDGAFTIKDVPPGSYTLVAWHEYGGTIETAVTVKEKGTESVTIDLAKAKK